MNRDPDVHASDVVPIARPYLDDAERRAVFAVLDSGWISTGPQGRRFEEALARRVGTSYGCAVNSGTSAIQLALLASGVTTDDEVIVPAYSCVAALNPVETIGARPVPVDIDLETFSISPEALQAKVTRKTKALVLAHLFGLVAPAESVFSLLEAREDVTLIEDAALSLGAEWQGRAAGSLGDMSCFSFHPRKMITTGEGGMVLTDSEIGIAKLRMLRNYGASVSAWQRHSDALFALPDYDAVGFNYKLSDILAAIGFEQLRKLDHIIQMRRSIADRYRDALETVPWLRHPTEPLECSHVYQSYVCMVDIEGATESVNAAERNRLFRHLQQHRISTIQGAQAMADVRYYGQTYGWRASDYPNAWTADQTSLALPIFPGLSADEQARVVDAVKSFEPRPLARQH